MSTHLSSTVSNGLYSVAFAAASLSALLRDPGRDARHLLGLPRR